VFGSLQNLAHQQELPRFGLTLMCTTGHRYATWGGGWGPPTAGVTRG
jgi:hypothetical protein